jgi:hypothetical protein
MKPLHVREHIEAPCEQVFARAADFARAPETITAIKKIEMLTPGPTRVGTRFRETRVMFGREATEEMEVVAFEPPRRIALGAESCGCRYHSELRFTPAAGGGTDVEMTFVGTPLTLFAKIVGGLMLPLMKKAMVKACGQDLRDLKAAVESGPRPAGRAAAEESA